MWHFKYKLYAIITDKNQLSKHRWKNEGSGIERLQVTQKIKKERLYSQNGEEASKVIHKKLNMKFQGISASQKSLSINNCNMTHVGLWQSSKRSKHLNIVLTFVLFCINVTFETSTLFEVRYFKNLFITSTHKIALN